MEFFKLLTVFLPLLSLLTTAAAATPSPPPYAAAEFLRSRGYSLFASTLISTGTNFSGTIFAPPDLAFSPNRRFSAAYNSLRSPLPWRNLTDLPDGTEIQTLLPGNCLFVRNSGGDLLISATKNQISPVRIKQPEIYVDDSLIVHGIDGVLYPTSASKCSAAIDRKFVDHAIRVLRRRGFTVAAAALSFNRPEMLRLDPISYFAPPDRALFANPNGFDFNFRRHVLLQRHRFEDLARYPPKITVFPTLAEKMTLTVDSVNGAVTVNGVKVNSTVYENRWITVFSISESLDDAVSSPPPPCVTVNGAVNSPPPPPATQCRILDFPVEIEGGDLLCPVPARKLLGEDDDVARSRPSDEDPLVDDVAQSAPFILDMMPSVDDDEDQVRAPTLKEPVNIADDLFFYS